jgi:hypothetical protein
MPGASTTSSATSSSIYTGGTTGLPTYGHQQNVTVLNFHHFRRSGLLTLNKCVNHFLHTDNGKNSTDHIERYDRLQRIVAEAAQYRTLREVVKSDPQITPHTAALLRRAFNVDSDDAAFINESATA